MKGQGGICAGCWMECWHFGGKRPHHCGGDGPGGLGHRGVRRCREDWMGLGLERAGPEVARIFEVSSGKR